MNRASLPAGAEPIALRTLGGIELVAPAAGSAVAQLLAKPRPLALFVYLALAEPAGLQQRDTLLALFWPGSDNARARGSLRQAIYRLRRSLGSDVMTRRGDEVGINNDVVTCDAVRFAAALRNGDLVQALELYRGDLLPGFFIDGSPGFAHWLDHRRTALRSAAAGAARRLAESAADRGDNTDAVAWLRRAIGLEPGDETSLQRLVELLADDGDRAGALAEYESFARHMREEYELEPSARTRVLVADLRDGDARDPTPAATPDPRRVLVAVFENRTGATALEPFGSLVADAIAQGVARLDGVQVVPLTAALVLARHLAAVDGAVAEADRVRQLTRESGAGTVVSGAYYVAGDELVVQGWIGDARSGSMTHALGPARAPIAAPLPAVRAVEDQACTVIALQLETRVSHVRAAGRAPSYEAHAAYVEGLTRFVDGDWRGAVFHFELAAAGDASYPLPLIVSGIAWWNLSDLVAAQSAADRAQALMAGAGPFERSLLDMVHAWLAGDWDAAHAAVQRQAELAPGSIPSFQVAEEARRRRRPRETVRVLMSLDPTRGELRGWIYYWVVLTEALHMLGEHTRELEAAQRARTLFPGSPLALRLEVHARAALGDVDGLRACIDESLASPGRREPRAGALMREAAHELIAHGHRGPVADALLAQSLTWYEELPDEARARLPVQRAIARARYDAGDLAGAARLFAAVAGDAVTVTDCLAVHHTHLQAHIDHGYLGAIAVRRGDEAEAEYIETLLTAARDDPMFGSTFYWRAAMAALRGDGPDAARLLRHAFANGMPYELFIHRDPHFEQVRDEPAFSGVLAFRG